MNPSIDDRLASIIRSLTDIVMPGLAEDAGLAREQLHLTIGHLNILRAHIEGAPAFESCELEDAIKLATGLAAVAHGGRNTEAAKTAVQLALAQSRDVEHARETRRRINAATDQLVHALGLDGSAACRAHVPGVLIPLQADRALKDRRWFALMGFDSELSGAG
jgi:hypothetical protein